MTESSAMFSDNRPLHERLQSHLENCSDCIAAIETINKPVGIGSRTALCSRYLDIISVWSQQEGAANNIVAHDEFGNPASGDDYWEKRPGGFQ